MIDTMRTLFHVHHDDLVIHQRERERERERERDRERENVD